jgi:hypothetical protein
VLSFLYPCYCIVDKLVGLEVRADKWAHVVGGLDALQEAQQLEELGVAVVIVPALNRDAIVDLVAVCIGRVVHQQRLSHTGTAGEALAWPGLGEEWLGRGRLPSSSPCLALLSP